MKNFNNIKDLVSFMFLKLDNEYSLVSVVAGKKMVTDIMTELLNYNNVILESCDMANDDDYSREYLISLFDDVESDYWYVNIEKDYNAENGKYFGTDGYVLFNEDVNSKSILDKQNNESVFLVGHDWFTLGENTDEDTEQSYMVNGNTVDRETFNEYLSKFAPDLVDNNDDSPSVNDNYSISVKCNLDADEALEIIADMERRMTHMNDMFREMDNFRRLFNW